MTNDIKLDICCVMSCKLYNIRKFAMLIEIYFTIAKFAILRGIYFTIATFAKVRSQKQYSQLRYSQFNRVTTRTRSFLLVLMFTLLGMGPFFASWCSFFLIIFYLCGEFLLRCPARDDCGFYCFFFVCFFCFCLSSASC